MSSLRSTYFSILLFVFGVPFSLSNSNFLHVQRGLALREGLEQARKACPEKITKRVKAQTLNRIKSLLNPSGIHEDPLRKSYLDYVPNQEQVNFEVDSLCERALGSTSPPVNKVVSEVADALNNAELVNQDEFEALDEIKKGKIFFSFFSTTFFFRQTIVHYDNALQ